MENPYAPPQRLGLAEERPGDAGLRLARATTGCALLSLIASGATALALRASLWNASAPSRNGPLHVQIVNLILSLHQCGFWVACPPLLGATGALLLPEAMKVERPPFMRLQVASLISWLVGSGALLAMSFPGASAAQPSRGVWAIGAIALGVALTLVYFVGIVARGFKHASWPGRIASIALVVAVGSFLLLLVLAARPLVDPFYSRLSDPLATLSLKSIFSRTLFAALSGCLLHVFLRRRIVEDAGTPKAFVAKVYLLVGALPALMLVGLAEVILTAPNAPLELSDTYFIVGELHAGISVVVMTFLAAFHLRFRYLSGRSYRELPARVAAFVVSLGSAATTIAMLVLGGSGMPRRYSIYIAQLESPQRAVTYAALATAAGFGIAVVALLEGNATRA